MKHLWVFQGINDVSRYDYRCVNCNLSSVLEFFNDLQDLGSGILCYREPIQLELF